MAQRCSFCGERPPPGQGVVTGPGVVICRTCASIAVDVLSVPGEQPSTFVLDECSVLAPHPRQPRIDVIRQGAVVVRHGSISWVGAAEDLPDRYRGEEKVDCEGRMVVPGFVDSGTWLLGSAHRGRPDPARIVTAARAGLSSMLAAGVTTVDVRAGGTPDPVLDTILLAAARTVGETGLCQVVVTWMVHPDLSLEEIRSVMGPTASRLASLAMIVDNGIDPLPPRLAAVAPLTPRLLASTKPEADQALSIEFSGTPIALAGSVVTIRPDSLGDRGSARMLVAGDALPALASAYDPHGVSMVGLGWMMLMAMELGELTSEEALWAATRGSALALGDELRGLVRAGAAADLVIVDGESAWDLIRRPGARPWNVMVSGVSMTE